MNKKTAKIIIIISLSIAFLLTISINWLYSNFGHLTLEEIVFHLKVPMEGTSTDMIWKYLIQCPWKIIALTIIVSILLIKRMKEPDNKKEIKISVGIAIVLFVASMTHVVIATDIIGYVYNQTNDSNFIAEEYVNPEQVNIQFPEQKRNLIYIFLESMETTFASKENGGISEKDLIPEISQLAKQNLNFSNTNTIGGAYTPTGTTWTIAAMTAQTCGIPLKIGVEDNSLSEHSTFLEGAHSIGEILDDNGYHNFLLLGSDAVFGGRKNLFEQHGNYEIWDSESAIAEKRISEKVWWGYSDDNLFKFAKEKILNLSEQEEPFNFTMLTVDTHFPDGYECEECPNKWDEQYKNVISCSSKKVGEFVNWIKQQDFYENTTIVIAGDHLTMQSNFFELQEGQEYEKKVVNIIINSAIEVTNTNRQYSTMDLYPTTLGALGATIEGNKLALGTNLFSDEQTLIEKYGFEHVDKELKKVSKFYDNNILVENKEGM
ncbi:MAG: LTA synthase family protein [Clostridia bacterium]|nr:LTA synthase family protein [Clostridia bacterium]